MKKNKALLLVLGILGNAILIELVILALAAFGYFVFRSTLSEIGNFFFILGILILIVAGFSIGGVRQNFGVLPQFMPLQKILTQNQTDGMDGAGNYLVTNAFSIYISLAGLMTFLIGFLLNTKYAA